MSCTYVSFLIFFRISAVSSGSQRREPGIDETSFGRGMCNHGIHRGNIVPHILLGMPGFSRYWSYIHHMLYFQDRFVIVYCIIGHNRTSISLTTETCSLLVYAQSLKNSHFDDIHASVCTLKLLDLKIKHKMFEFLPYAIPIHHKTVYMPKGAC